MGRAETSERMLDGSYEGPVEVRGPLLRLMLWLTPAYLSLFAVWAGAGLLLSLQVEYIDPANKVGNLAIVTTIGAFASMAVQPLAGLASDRTRTRVGRRTPWLIGGSVAGGAARVFLSVQSTIPGVVAGWLAVCIAYNCAQAPLTAILPDRIPRLARGRFSAMSGLGVLVGLLSGQFLAANLSEQLSLAYLILAVVCAVVFTTFAILNPDRTEFHSAPEPLSLRVLTSAFWVNPVKYPDFFWGFISRITLNLGYYIVAGAYLLYVLADYIDLGTTKAAATVPLLTLVAAPGSVLATILAGPLSDKLRRRKIFLVASGCTFAAAMAAPILSPTLPGIIIAFIIGGLGYGVFQSVDSVLMSEVLPSQKTFAKDLGIVNIAVTLPQTLAPALAGAIVLTAGYAWLFPAAIALSLIGAFAVVPIKSVR